MKQGWMLSCALVLAACSLEGSSFERLEAEPAHGGGTASAAAADAELDGFVSRVVQDADQIWASDFKRRNKTYVAARPVGVSSAAPNPCAAQERAADPQCQDAQPVYIDLDFQRALQARFGKEASAPQTYAIAHAMGHHVQKVLGLDRKVATLVAGRPLVSHAVELQLELQADCLAGVWTRVTKSKGTLDREQVEQALRQASEVGAERQIDKPRDGNGPLETFTYAIPRRRLYWFSKGFNSTRIEDCDTFETE